jgi:hypothetical protein
MTVNNDVKMHWQGGLVPGENWSYASIVCQSTQ